MPILQSSTGVLLLTLSAVANTAFIPPYASPRELAGNSFGIPGQNRTFDYVIVGGGLAGSVVATRLLELQNVTIALVEAGSFYEITNGNNSQVPFYSTNFIGNEPGDYQPLIDWSLKTVPQAGINDQVIHYAQGKCLGGSSGRNQMIYHRGTVGAMQRWAEQVGDDAYLWDNFLPYFKKSFEFTPPGNSSLRAANATVSIGNGYQPSAYSKTGGPVHLSFTNFALPFSSYMSAFKAIGLSKAVDFSSGILNGFQYFPWTIGLLFAHRVLVVDTADCFNRSQIHQMASAPRPRRDS